MDFYYMCVYSCSCMKQGLEHACVLKFVGDTDEKKAMLTFNSIASVVARAKDLKNFKDLYESTVHGWVKGRAELESMVEKQELTHG